MKTTIIQFAAAVLLIAGGCNNASTPGGPGPAKPDNKPLVGTPENAFQLSTPTLSTSVPQGGSKVATISVKRGKDFADNVSIKFENVPAGVRLDPMPATMKSSEDKIDVTVSAGDDAVPGDYVIKAIGHSATGPDATNDFKVTVSKK